MGEDKWTRRRPGRVSGTVVPPPAGDDLPPVPRRGADRPRLRRDGRNQETPECQGTRKAPVRAESPAGASVFESHDSREIREASRTSTASARRAGPEMPDTVRQLFPPILRARKVLPAGAMSLHPSATRAQPDEAQAAAPPTPEQDQPTGRAARSMPDRPAGRRRLAGLRGRPAHRAAPAADRAAFSDRGSPALPSAGAMPLAVAWGVEPWQTGALRRMLPHSGSSGTGLRFKTGPRSGTGQSGGRQVLWMVALTALLLLTAAGTAVALMRHPIGRGSEVAKQRLASVSGAGAARSAAAEWVARQVSRSSIIGCDTVVCADLLKAGVPSSDLLVLRSSAQDPLGADVVVATSVLQSLFGTRLRSEYAPVVLATFGHGSATVDVRLVAVDGAAAYKLALRKDLAARQAVGAQLIGNKRIALPAAAEAQLAAGNVDPRLLITLPALAERHPIQVLGFFDRAPRASSGVPLAGVELSGADPQAGLSPRAYLRWLTSFLRSQRSVYRAASVSTATRHGRPVVSIRFTWPTPIGLLH